MTAPEHPPFVTFLSDFGTSDDFAGICHGVINLLCPDARVIHITHGIQPQAIGQGARVLAGAIHYLPVGVHLAVVDPGVGSERRAVALRSGDGRHFVGPDNGLLIPAAESCGGVVEAVAITNPDIMLQPVSRTFHGRDVFAPAAARLASGVPLSELGPAIEPARLVRRSTPTTASRGRCCTPPSSTSTGSATSSWPSRRPSSTASSRSAAGPRSTPATTATTPSAQTRSPTSGRASSSSMRTRWGCCRSPSTRATRPN